MKATTKIVNRLMNLSSLIYTVENLSTLAEIKITTVEYKSLVLSNTKVIITGADIEEIKHHSIKILKLNFKQYSAGTNRLNIVIHISRIINVGKFLFIMNSNQLIFLSPQFSGLTITYTICL